MDPIIKQRLVGTLVLLALGVVFWPIIFVQAPEPQLVMTEPMPLRPLVDMSPIAEPSSPEEQIAAELPRLPDQADVEQKADTTTALTPDTDSDAVSLSGMPDAPDLDPAAPRTRSPDPVALDEEGLGVAWVLQVATVSAEKRANDLRDELIEKRYKAFVRSVDRDGDKLFRVQIGPKVERAKLLPIKREVDALLQVDSAILRYVQ